MATMSPVDSLRGHLLVASPSLLDPNFRRAVVLVTEHNEDGAAGLVLNRPSPVEVSGAVPQLEPLVEDGEQVWVGGPVQPEAVLVLGEFFDPDDAFTDDPDELWRDVLRRKGGIYELVSRMPEDPRVN